jgi:small subunit ribosomal protein S5
MVGIRNILTKSLGNTNPINLVKAAMNGLEQLKDAREVARLRGVPLEELLIDQRAAAPREGPAEAPEGRTA